VAANEEDMLVLNRFVIGLDTADAFVERAHAALAALAERPGYRSGRLARALDEPTSWCLATEWESVGAYRRALGAFDVKVQATPLLAESIDEPSAYEPLASAEPGGPVVVAASDLAPGAGRAGPVAGRSEPGGVRAVPGGGRPVPGAPG
jgi:quinol monooxygenase YgiN